MPPRPTTVDTLNKLAGKQKTSVNGADKLVLKPSDISFPATRQSPRLKKLNREPQKPSKRGRDFELPDEDDRVDATPVLKKRKLNAKQNKTSKSSPLKQMGYDPVILHPDESINLGDSPSQNTRSGRAGYLKALIRKESRPVTRLSQVAGVIGEGDNESEAVMNADAGQDYPEEENEEAGVEVEAELEVEAEDSGRDEQDEQIEELEEEEGEEGEEEEQAADGVEDDPEDPDGHENESIREADSEQRNEPPPSAQPSQPHHSQEKKKSKSKAMKKSSILNGKPHSKNSETSQEKPPHHGAENGDPRKNGSAVQSANGPERPSQSSQKSSQATERGNRQRQQQFELARRAEEKRMAKLQKKFLERYIGDKAADLEGCSQYWAKLGGAVLWLREIYGETPEQGWSREGYLLSENLERLAQAYIDLYKKRHPPGELNHLIEEEISSLEEAFTSTTLNLDGTLGIDLYRFIIPRLLLDLRRFFRARLGQGAILDWSAMEELTRILEVAKDLCEIAQECTPRDNALTYGTKQKLRQDIIPSLRMILAPFKMKLREHKRAERDRREIDKLEKLQKARLRAFEEGRRARYERSYEYDSRNSTSRYRQEQSRVQRQSTEDIPANSGDWTDREVHALVNGLTYYRGEDRYQQTFDRYEHVLGRRDISEMIDQARYLRDIAADLDPGDGSMEWLMSVKGLRGS